MAKEEFMHLQHSESVVAQMSATIFAALLQKTELPPANEDELVEKALSIAINSRRTVPTSASRATRSGPKKDAGSAYLLG